MTFIPKNSNHKRLLPAMIISASLVLSGLAVLKQHASKPQHKDDPRCPATVSLTGVGRTRKVPLEIFTHNTCWYGADGVSVMIVP
jgi:hypothetical protein